MDELFAKRFKELRNQHGFSMQTLGEKIGVGKSTIAAYESGEKKPKHARLKLICDVFGVSTDYLLGNSNDPLTKSQTRNLAILLKETNDFHYNGVPLSENDLKLFNDILKRMLKDVKKSNETSNSNSNNCE